MTTSRILRRWIPTAAAALAVAALATPAVAQQAIRLGTSSVGSSFYAITVGMTKIIQQYAGINATAESLGGSHANMFGVARGKVDFAMANSGAAYDRYHGNAPFKEKFELRLVGQGQPSFRHIFITKSSGIKSPADFVGKTFLAKRKPLPELEKLANAVIEVYNLPKDKIKIVSSRNLGEMNRLIRAGSVDITAYPFALRQPVATKLFHDGLIEPLILSDDKYAEVKKRLPDMFYEYEVKANHFKNQPKAFKTFGLTTQLATSAKMDEETVYKVTKAIFGHTKEFMKYHGSARFWNSKQSMLSPKVPFHPGAIRYYKEAGAWTAEMDAVQARLLKRM